MKSKAFKIANAERTFPVFEILNLHNLLSYLQQYRKETTCIYVLRQKQYYEVHF